MLFKSVKFTFKLKVFLIVLISAMLMLVVRNSYGTDTKKPVERQEIDWTQDEKLKLEKVEVNLVKTFYKGETLPEGILQGMAITDNYIVIAQIENNKEKTKLSILDKKTLKLLNTVESYCFGHASDMVFNPTTGKILILGTPNKIASFSINDKLEIENVHFRDCVRTYSGIDYDPEGNFYVAYRNGVMYVLDSRFEEIKSFPIIQQLVNQGITYKNKCIFYSCWESGSPKKRTYNKKQKNSNLIYVYNLQGGLEKTLFIPNYAVNGEIESLCFTDNGKLLIGYNIRIDKKPAVNFYECDLKNHIDLWRR